MLRGSGFGRDVSGEFVVAAAEVLDEGHARRPGSARNGGAAHLPEPDRAALHTTPKLKTDYVP